MRKLDLGFAGSPLDGEREEGLEASGVGDEEEGLVGACGCDVILERECEPEGILGGEGERGRERFGRGEAMAELLSATREDTITTAFKAPGNTATLFYYYYYYYRIGKPTS